jgi:hypothetical protein
MNPEEQNAFLSSEYAEAIRYMDNAKETLKRTEKLDYGWYKDEKYVRSACGIAYLGVLVALDAWLTMKGVRIPNKRKHPTIDFYEYSVAKLDKKMLDYLRSAYNLLHIDGYYRKEKSVRAIEDGFDTAYLIIEKIKPENPVDVPETGGDRVKRILNRLLISAAGMFRV